MRPDLTPEHKALIESQDYDIHWKLEVANGSGTMVDLSDRIERIRGSLSSPRQPIKSLDVDFLREPNDDGSISLAPFLGASVLNRLDDAATYSPLLLPGRMVVASAIPTERGAERPLSGFYEFFRGRVTAVRSAENYGNAGISCADQFHVLTLAKNEQERIYPAGTPIEDVMQSVITDFGYGFTLNVEEPTGAVLQEDFRVQIQRVGWQTLWSLAQSIGSVVWGRYNAFGVEELTLFEPDRQGSGYALSFDSVRDARQLDVDESEIGNVGYLEYSDEHGERQMVGPLVDANSIAKYGDIRRPFWIVEPEDSSIRSAPDATQMLGRALSDVAEPDAEIGAVVGAFVWGEVSVDRYQIPANDRLWDSSQIMAPYSVEFSHEVGKDHESLITFRGRPTAGARTWLGRGGSVQNPISAYELTDLRLIGGAPEGYQRHAFRAGSKVAEIWWGFAKFGAPWNTDIWPLLEMRHLPDGQYYVDTPEVGAGELGALELRPYMADGTVHPQAEVVKYVVHPVPPRTSPAIDADSSTGVIRVSASASPTYSALPIEWEIRSGSKTGPVLASGTWTSVAAARSGVNQSTHSALGNIALTRGRQAFYLRTEDSAGNEQWVADAIDSVREGEIDNPLLMDPSFAPIRWVATKPTSPGQRIGERVYVFNPSDLDHLRAFEWTGAVWDEFEATVGYYSYLPILLAGAIAAEHLKAGSVTAEKLAAMAITADKLDVSELSAISANLGTITAGTIEAVDGTFVGTVKVDPEGLGNALEFEHDGSPVGGMVTTAGAARLFAGEAGDEDSSVEVAEHLTLLSRNQILLASGGTLATPGGIVVGNATDEVGFYNANPVAKPTVTGSRGGNAALTSLISALASLGLVTDSTT